MAGADDDNRMTCLGVVVVALLLLASLAAMWMLGYDRHDERSGTSAATESAD